MTAKELRETIVQALRFAQSHSESPAQGSDPQNWHFADQTRMRFFFAHLAGGVSEGDPKLAEILKAFMDAAPGENIAMLVPDTQHKN